MCISNVELILTILICFPPALPPAALQKLVEALQEVEERGGVGRGGVKAR